ncbi:hypothetical protein ACFOON_12115 [Novosphingobium piscinae]|uniref:Uncharacterized protein n=1 Tax=Novosphingobium piscinae TaxID=1507448 RepID=A0A7X1KP22_9SPHN|nr:hypothetical protein [Novosphingobium piscinae]MBC2668038.1 hypothetical protein [Novosphingobium piscinae]
MHQSSSGGRCTDETPNTASREQHPYLLSFASTGSKLTPVIVKEPKARGLSSHKLFVLHAFTQRYRNAGVINAKTAWKGDPTATLISLRP